MRELIEVKTDTFYQLIQVLTGMRSNYFSKTKGFCEGNFRKMRVRVKVMFPTSQR